MLSPNRISKEYDFIIAGGGVAGLSLAYHLIRNPLRSHSILVVDRDAKDQNDRTLSFWTDQLTLFDDIVYRSWSQLQFVGEEPQIVDLRTFRYDMIRGIDFYRFVQRALSACPNVEFLRGTVNQINDGDDQASVSVDTQTMSGEWVFDSRFERSWFKPDLARYRYLQMHFEGWVIETPDETFDPQVATPFDFRTPQENEMRFFYVLPFSERQALVEYILFSPGEYDQAIRVYIETVLGAQDYNVLSKERGIIPLTNQPFPRQVGQRIMTIGTLGGRVKPSSGYAFLRIQQDSAAIVRSLLRTEHPFDVPPDSRRCRLYDSGLLQVIHHHGEQIKPIFAALVRNNPIERVFRFLDGTASLREDLVLIASLPPGPFLRALFRSKVLHRV